MRDLRSDGRAVRFKRHGGLTKIGGVQNASSMRRVNGTTVTFWLFSGSKTSALPFNHRGTLLRSASYEGQARSIQFLTLFRPEPFRQARLASSGSRALSSDSSPEQVEGLVERATAGRHEWLMKNCAAGWASEKY
jgi:hypothetical protein